MAGERGPGRASGDPGQPPQFGRLLRQYRLAAGLTQDALAEKAGLSLRGIADLERGARRFPHPGTIERLANALELSPAERSALIQTPRQFPEASTASIADARVAGQPPRSPFVGRDGEMHVLNDAFLAAAASRGGTAMLAGEPGIGKTALCERFADVVRLQGGLPLLGHCYEEGSLSLPYLPFLEVLRAYLRGRDPRTLRQELGPAATELARLLPELCDQLDLKLRPPGDAREDRWRLLSSVSEYLRAAAVHQPLVLILEDLHDADDATIDLLLHLTRTLQNARVLLLGTYRDVEVDRVHPLSGALAELRRITPVQRLTLRGLSTDEVLALVETMQGQQAAPELVRAIQQQTEGNPLFVQEVARYWMGTPGPPHVGAHAPVLAHVPEGLRDVIGKRLSGLSGPANRLLSAAAVIGREFRLDVVGQLVPIPEDELIMAVQEAAASAILEEQPSVGATARYRFTHALFRQALYEELIAPRRIRLHQHVARALERVYARHLDEHAAELAEHFGFCSEDDELARAVSYGHVAAQHAMDVFAYGEAVRLLQRALQVQDVLDPEDVRRSDLLLALGEAMLPMEHPGQAARTVAEEAYRIATNKADSQRAFGACILALQALFRDSSLTGAFGTGEVRQWLERAEQLVMDDTAECALVDCYRGLHHIDAGDPARGQAFLRHALNRAQALGDDEMYFIAASFAAPLLQTVHDRTVVEQLANDLFGRQVWPRRAWERSYVLASLVLVFIEQGDRNRASQVLQQVWELAQKSNDVSVRVLARLLSAWHAFIEGQLEQAAMMAASADEEADRTGARLAASASVARGVAARALFYLGRSKELNAEAGRLTRASLANNAVVLAFLGRCQEAAAIRNRFDTIDNANDQTSSWILADLLEVSVRCGDRNTATVLVPRLSPLANRLQPVQLISYGRLLGDASVLLGRSEQAEAYYRQALQVCERAGCRPELALTELALAELLLTRNEANQQSRALALLDSAIAAFKEMHMQPSLDQARNLANSVRLGHPPTRTATCC